MSSKKVVIRRREVDLEGLPKEIAREAKRPLSSVYKDGVPLSGLSKEQEHLLEKYIDCAPNEPGFRDKATIFWKELSLSIPFGGHELEVGLGPDDKPISPRDYIIYQWALKHPLVAQAEHDKDGRMISAEEVMRRDMKAFYLVDSEQEFQRMNTTRKQQETAFKQYMLDQTDKQKMIQIISYLAPSANVYSMNPDELAQTLYSLQQSDAAQYVAISTDKNIELRTLLANLVNFSIVTKTGNTYAYMDEPMGSTEDESIAWMKNARNGKQVLEMKNKYAEAMRVRSQVSRDQLFPQELHKPQSGQGSEVIERIEQIPSDVPPDTNPEAFVKNQEALDNTEAEEEKPETSLVSESPEPVSANEEKASKKGK